MLCLKGYPCKHLEMILYCTIHIAATEKVNNTWDHSLRIIITKTAESVWVAALSYLCGCYVGFQGLDSLYPPLLKLSVLFLLLCLLLMQPGRNGDNHKACEWSNIKILLF